MKKFNHILSILFLLVGIYMLIYRLQYDTIYNSLINLSVIPIVLLPWLIKKIFHYELPEKIVFIYLVFTFLSLFLGSVMRFYGRFPWYDTFTHFLSGFVTSILALLIIKENKLESNPLWINILFIIGISLSIASLWEFFEFTCDKLFDKDAQHVLTTGVDDTMKDMLVAFLGSIIFSSYYFVKQKSINKSKGK